MDELAKRDQHDLSSSNAIALTIQALINTYQQLRDSDLLLKLSKALPNAQDEDPLDQVQVSVAVHARNVPWKSVDSI
jgi:hypothetical protein